jgi:hypothetical protein
MEPAQLLSPLAPTPSPTANYPPTHPPTHSLAPPPRSSPAQPAQPGAPPHPKPWPTIEGDGGLGGVAADARQHHRVLVLHRLAQLDLGAHALQQAQQELGAAEALLMQRGVRAHGPARGKGGGVGDQL